MIVDNISNCERYAALHPAFAAAFDFLKAGNFTPGETVELDGKKLFAMISEVNGVGRDCAKLEAHQQYIDIQYIVAGADCIGWRDITTDAPGTKYDTESDFRLIDLESISWFELPPGYFAIFFPEDAHAPLASNEVMTKVVVKVKL